MRDARVLQFMDLKILSMLTECALRDSLGEHRNAAAGLQEQPAKDVAELAAYVLERVLAARRRRQGPRGSPADVC